MNAQGVRLPLHLHPCRAITAWEPCGGRGTAPVYRSDSRIEAKHSASCSMILRCAKSQCHVIPVEHPVFRDCAKSVTCSSQSRLSSEQRRPRLGQAGARQHSRRINVPPACPEHKAPCPRPAQQHARTATQAHARQTSHVIWYQGFATHASRKKAAKLSAEPISFEGWLLA